MKVFLSSADNEEILIDYRSEGEQFGLVSVISGDHSRANVVAVEDTICYLIAKEKIINLFQSNPNVNDYFMRSFFINFIDKTYDENKRRYVGLGESERRLFTTKVGNIVSREPVIALQSVSIKEAAEVMSANAVSSIILTDSSGAPLGILTDRDLRDKVVSKGMDINNAASGIMSSPLIHIDSEELCFEALLSMMRSKIHHLLVLENGEFKGVVTNHDFIALQGSSPTVLAREIEAATSADELASMTPKLFKAVSALVFEGAKAMNIAGFITEVAEKVILKSLEFAEAELGASPIPYSVFLYGGSGRRELTLTLNIRIGIICEDTNNLPLIKECEEYFRTLAEKVNYIMNKFCPDVRDGILHAKRMKSISDWKNYFDRWKYVVRGLPKAQYFDVRHIKGEEALVDTMRDHVFNITKASDELMDLVAAVTVENRPPLGFFRRFVVEKSGEHRNEFDLTMKGIRPLVDAVRVLAVEHNYRDPSTLKRLQFLSERYEFPYAEDIKHALNYLDSLLIHHQLEQIEHGLAPDPFINPEKLTNIEKNTLREIFKLTAKIYDIIEKSYKTERVGY